MDEPAPPSARTVGGSSPVDNRLASRRTASVFPGSNVRYAPGENAPREVVDEARDGSQETADSSARMMKALVGQLGAHEALYPVDGKGKELRPVGP